MKTAQYYIGLFSILCAVFMSTANAASPQVPGTTGSFVPYSEAQRAITFTESRQWQTVAGEILVCPQPAVSKYEKRCFVEGREGDSQWITIEQYATKFVPNAVIAGIQYSFTGTHGNQVLTVYFRKIPR
jgi:hypothetical protein